MKMDFGEPNTASYIVATVVRGTSLHLTPPLDSQCLQLFLGYTIFILLGTNWSQELLIGVGSPNQPNQLAMLSKKKNN
jgi:hypothetical protein